MKKSLIIIHNFCSRYLSNLCYLRLEIVQLLLHPLWPQMRKRLLAVWKADIRPFPHSWTWTPFSVNANSLYIINKKWRIKIVWFHFSYNLYLFYYKHFKNLIHLSIFFVSVILCISIVWVEIKVKNTNTVKHSTSTLTERNQNKWYHMTKANEIKKCSFYKQNIHQSLNI